MKRRFFIKGVGTLAAAEAIATAIPQKTIAFDLFNQKSQTSGLSIMQGLTNETTTQISVDLPRSAKVEYTAVDRDSGRTLSPQWIRKAVNGESSTRVDKIFFSELEQGHRYQLNVKDTGKNKNLDERYFTTVDLNKENVKIAVMSCMKDSKSAHIEMWKSAQSVNADYYFFIGDAVYGDSFWSSGPDKLWKRFVETRATLGFYHWKNLKPALGVWDDHDFGKNNEDGDYKHKKANLKIYKSFFAQESLPSVLNEGPGNSSFFRAFNQNFLFLDSRYFRKLKYQGITGFLGTEQIEWASRSIQGSRGPTWVMEGSPFFGRADKSNTSYEATAPKELKLFLNEVSKWNSQAVFMGGDVHYSEISRLDKKLLGYESFEFISSNMHSSSKETYHKNPNQRLQASLKENFLLFTKTGLKEDPNWQVTCVGTGTKTLFNGLYHVG